MKIAFCYPPFSKNGCFPNLPQNRQFIYTQSDLVKLYPVVMATAATWLKNLGHQVLWLDGVTRRMKWQEFEKKLKDFAPEIVVLETKTPIMKKLWNYINKLITHYPLLITALVGDHVTYYPKESFKNCKVDYIITRGDYDFGLVELVANLLRGVRMTPRMVVSGLDNNLDKTPIIDRQLTRWRDYGEAYLFKPCAYMMFGRGCGVGKKRGRSTLRPYVGNCTFCIWQHSLWRCTARLRSPKHVVGEVKSLVDLGVKEIFDDTESGALWDYQWLKEFYQQLGKEKLLGKVTFSSNARGDQLDKKTCQLLKKLGYRLLKVGLESGSNKILKKINKKERIEDIIRGIKNAKDAGLRIMLTVMVGYPWETEEDVKKTYQITRELMFYKTKAGDCLQASVIIPYPGTPLWSQAKKNGWLTIEGDDYKKYDMSKPILQSRINGVKWCKKIWSIQKDLRFILKSGLTARKIDEIRLLLRGARSLLGHIKDYG